MYDIDLSNCLFCYLVAKIVIRMKFHNKLIHYQSIPFQFSVIFIGENTWAN